MKKLSYRAQKLLANVRNPNRWYKWTQYRESKAMQELVDHNLVVAKGRVISIELCYVPVGTTNADTEQFPEGEPNASA